MHNKKILIFISFLISFGFANVAQAGLIFKAPSSIGLISGLVGYWSFDGKDMAGNTAYDRSGQNNNGTLTNGPTRAIGKIGQGLSFDGVDDYVTIADSDTLSLIDQTVSVWFKNTGSGIQIVVEHEAISVPNDWGVFVDSDGTLKYFGTWSVDQSNDSNYNVRDNLWHNIIIVRSSVLDRRYFYVDGVLVFNVADTQTGTNNPDGVLAIGARIANLSLFFNGLIDDVRIYNRALTADEIKRLYRIGGTLKLGDSKSLNTNSLTSGLVGYWSFDESTHGTTSVADLSGNNNRGHLINGPQKAIGKIGQGLSFDGVDDQVVLPTSAVLSMTSSVTVSAWIRRQGNAATYARIFEHGMVSGAPNLEYSLIIDNTDKLAFGLTTGGVADETPSNATLPQNVWIHVVGTWDGTNKRLYINGSLDRTIAQSGTITEQNNTNTLGYRIGPMHNFNGLIDDVRIYNRALSADEIKRLYRIGGTLKLGSSQAQNTGSLTKGLVGYWSFDESTHGTTSVADLSGNNNRGFMINGPQKAIGKIGQGLSFDVVDDLITMGDVLDFTTANLSFSAWFYPQSGGHAFPRIIDKDNNLDNGYYFVYDKTNGALMFKTAGTTNMSSNNSVITQNAWNHVVVTYDGANVRFYVNGVAQGAPAYTTLPVNTVNAFVVGNIADSSRPLDGKLDDVRIYNRALSASEIQRLYNMGR